ncbi:uncharacterized protein APUU_80962S [Aspergillus puulaauensis]|uniref:Toxin biosynthesis protein n=1 Tax=Aspergillus puulaauensis TaxID=1220207 RepID=A0A7R7Y1X2_9EURO|nr:uncharacterized protein APUU_80962S [Aspergillus puulaauensis]BCS30659.1 hypothetical protein APUU_80962S [Aspergillus puulaauensis]
MHPKLFHSLIFLEPMMQVERPSKAGRPNPALWSSTREDTWASREQAENDLRENPFWRRWDSRAYNQYVKYGLRSCPTALYPDASTTAVTLATTKAQEAWSYLRFNSAPTSDRNSVDIDRFVNADLARVPKDGDLNSPENMFVAPWPCIAFVYLPYVRPSVLYVFGEKSHINVPDRRKDKLQRTGEALGGSGGLDKGRVRQEIIRKGSHMVPLEKVHDTARILASWLESQMELYKAEVEFWTRQYDSQKSERDGLALSSMWMDFVNGPADIKRPRRSKM